ncbi:MAG: hypothetical protein IPK12_19405 [Gemmatimonadetes bacterium]|nr:hypothetical protein [Gemmatimonadota bacterium]
MISRERARLIAQRFLDDAQARTPAGEAGPGAPYHLPRIVRVRDGVELAEGREAGVSRSAGGGGGAEVGACWVAYLAWAGMPLGPGLVVLVNKESGVVEFFGEEGQV